MESVFDHIMVILAVPLGLFIFLILLSWIIALAADPYAATFLDYCTSSRPIRWSTKRERQESYVEKQKKHEEKQRCVVKPVTNFWKNTN